MESYIKITQLNDFVFCPASIYFHDLYGDADKRTVQTTDQTLGTASHKTIIEQSYSTRSDMLQGIYVYSSKYNLLGQIDLFDTRNGLLTERKRQIKHVYDGYIYQLFGQYFGLLERGFEVKALRLYSHLDNKVYPVPLPQNDPEMFDKFEKTIQAFESFDLSKFVQTNPDKCARCIYANACDRSL